MIATESPFPLFFDTDGDPLDSGFVYLGVANQNPETAPIPAWWDSAGTQPAALPIRTLNGFPMRNGTPATIFTAGAYSVTVKNRHGVIVYYAASSLEFSSVQQLTDQTNAAMGSALVGYKPPFTGAVGRSVSSKLQETVSAGDFGLATTNTGAQNNAAMVLAIAYAVAQGGLTLHVPRGTYNFSGTIDTSAANDFRITGDGIDATILQINDPTVDFVSVGAAIYQTIDNLTLTSSVNRTAGAMVKTTGFWRRGLLFRVKISKHYDGVNLFQFEHCTLMETNIVTPTGNGTALIVGNAAATNQGANLNLVTVFVRGNDETNPVSAAVGRRGMLVYDIEAIYAVNLDLSIFTDQVIVIEPTTQAANCFFTSCYFDATVGGDNIQVKGAGIKNRFQFTGCWFASAGRYGAGAANQAGVNFNDAGSYIDWKFTGCEFVGSSGPGIIATTPQVDVTVSGCSFNSCGTNTVLPTSIYLAPTAAQTKALVVTGSKFIPFGTSTSDVNCANSNCAGNVLTGNEFLRGVSYASGASFGSVSGNSDTNTTDSIASAATLQVSPTKNFYTITGATNVGGLFRTYTGHTVTFVATGVFTWQNGGALVLAGGANFVTAAGSTITLICQPSGAVWREISRHV